MKHLKLFEAFNESVSDIPVLTETSPWEEIEAYLKWLYASKYQYHIDDDPEDIDSFDDATKKLLRANSDIMWGYNERPENKSISDKDLMNMLWDVYGDGSDMMTNEAAKAMKDMSKDEKIASYRTKISAERAKPAPDLSKIETWNKKIAEIGAKAKKTEPKK